MDVLELARELIHCDTAGRAEDCCLDLVEPILAVAGFRTRRLPWRPGRSNLLAWLGDSAPDLILSGHVDTVPFDPAQWSVDPLGGEVADGRLYGRGASDMKGGVAALVGAAIGAAALGGRGFGVLLTASEETGCHGARAVAQSGVLPRAPRLIIGEATGNQVWYGHKGVTWLQVTAAGQAAHGSRPELGNNAIEILARLIEDLTELSFGVRHKWLGERTVSVGTINGGTQVNIVPDRATMTLDVRTVPGAEAEAVSDWLDLFAEVSVETLLELPTIWTPPTDSFASSVARTVAGITGLEQEPVGASYFTDGAVLTPPDRPRTLVLGPGALDQPHSVDEWCAIDAIYEAERIYGAILAVWRGGGLDA